MSENIKSGLLQLTNVKGDGNEEIRVFIPSEKINIFPCSRRGQKTTEGSMLNYDPEARLNTERTNRLRTSINGFTDSFIVNDNFVPGDTLIFVLAGYRIEIKNFVPADIIEALEITDGTIYAHLSLHDDIPFGVPNYYTEILYRQSTAANNNYIDVKYTIGNDSSDYFMGVSFTKEAVKDSIIVKDAEYTSVKELVSQDLELFSIVNGINGNWKLVEASKLPKVEHDTEPDSIKLSGDFTVEHTKDNGDKQTSFKVTKDETVLGKTVMSSLIVGEKADGDTFADGTIKAKEHIETPTLEATESIITPLLNVTNNEGTAKILADAATITGETVLNKLKVDNVTTNANSEITVESSLKVTGEATLKNGLQVTTGDTDLRKLTATELKVATDVLTVTKDEANFTKPVTVDNSLTANNVQIKDQGQVPALELVNLKDTNIYQLRFKFGTAIQPRVVTSFTEE